MNYRVTPKASIQYISSGKQKPALGLCHCHHIGLHTQIGYMFNKVAICLE